MMMTNVTMVDSIVEGEEVTDPFPVVAVAGGNITIVEETKSATTWGVGEEGYHDTSITTLFSESINVRLYFFHSCQYHAIVLFVFKAPNKT